MTDARWLAGVVRQRMNAAAIAAFSMLIGELGDLLEAFDVNPLICGPSGVLAVDALAIPRRMA